MHTILSLLLVLCVAVASQAMHWKECASSDFSPSSVTLKPDPPQTGQDVRFQIEGKYTPGEGTQSSGNHTLAITSTAHPLPITTNHNLLGQRWAQHAQSLSCRVFSTCLDAHVSCASQWTWGRWRDVVLSNTHAIAHRRIRTHGANAGEHGNVKDEHLTTVLHDVKCLF